MARVVARAGMMFRPPQIPASPLSHPAHCPACGTAADATADHLGYCLATCGGCALWFWAQRSAADYEAVYETPEYQEVQTADLEATTDPSHFVRHPTYAAFFRQVRAANGARLLDLGCGVGRFLRAAHSLGWDVRGIDTSARAIEIGARTAGFPMTTETLEQLRDAGATFDVVTAFEVLEHLEQPVEMLRSVISVLQPGGRFFCTVPNRLSPTVRTTRRQDWLPPVHLQFFTVEAMRRMLERVGLADIRTGYVWADAWPPFGLSTGALRRVAGYGLRRLSGKLKPDPVGIWATGRRAE